MNILPQPEESIGSEPDSDSDSDSDSELILDNLANNKLLLSNKIDGMFAIASHKPTQERRNSNSNISIKSNAEKSVTTDWSDLISRVDRALSCS